MARPRKDGSQPGPRKRSNGEGTIYPRTRNGTTRFYAELMIGWKEDGKKNVLHSPGFDTRDKARQWLTEQTASKDKHTLATPTKDTVAEFLLDWLDTVAVVKVKERTAADYRWQIEHYILPHIGKVPLQKLTQAQIQAMYATHLRAGRSPTTVHLIHAVLSQALNHAVESSRLMRSPAEFVKKPRKVKVKFTPLVRDQISLFLDAAKGERLHALYVLAVLSGLRRGELLGLRWQDVDLDEGTVTINQIYNRVGREWKFTTPKTDESQATLPLPAPALDALKRWHKEQGEAWLKNADALPPRELVFTTTVGTPINPSNLRKWYKALLVRAGCPDIRLHDLRHTMGTMMNDMGVKPAAIQAMMRHADFRTTMNLYVHTVEEQKREAAAGVDDYLKTTANRKAR